MKYYCPHFTCLLFVSYLLLLLLLHVDGILSLKQHNDRDALLAFKSQINDPNNYLSNWTSNPNSYHCNWYGVSCSSKFQNRVQSLSLQNLNLSGTIPSSLSNLSRLHLLDLSYNSFHGHIPSLLPRRLQILDLSFNHFHEWVPLLNNLNHLTYLNLGGNRLSSSTSLNSQLFNSLRNSTRLQVVKMFNNQLAGQLPNSVANLSSSLVHFCLANNFLTGSLPTFRNLSSLSLDNNRFTGGIPVELGALNNLLKLSVSDNRLSGEIPDILGNFTQIANLSLSYNHFTGRIPASVGQCKNLNFLDLGMNRLHGTIPKEIFQLSGLNALFLARNALTGSLPSEVSSLKMIQKMDISDNHLSGLIPEAIGECSGLQWLRMARNNFSGSIPSKIQNLGSLEILDLSSNNLSGQIPANLEKLQYMVNLNLSFNHLKGQVPVNVLFTNLTKVDLQGNTMLCSLNNTISRQLGISLCTTKIKTSFLLPIIIFVVVGAIVSLLVLIWVMMSLRNKRKITGSSSLDLPHKGVHETISYGEIKLATNNFAVENLIGKGGFGYVYKGVFNINSIGEEATILAVKVLDLKQSKASKSFNAECEALRLIRHRNLVKVITLCSSIDHKGDDFKALVMQFMPNGNLDTWLYPTIDIDFIEEQTGSCLDLLQRLNIAIDVASALKYLHHDCDPPVVHCDLKPSNILLDENMVAHVGDFGLARLLSHNPSPNNYYESSTLGLKGSIGYIAPEYGVGGKASTHGDVYNFGILLLEMLIAKRPSDEMFKEGFSITKLASSVMGASDSNQVMKVADPRLFKDYYEHYSSQSSNDSMDECSNNTNNNIVSYMGKQEKCIGAMIEVGLCCAAQEAKDRMNMKEASTKLQGIRHSMLPF